MKLSIKRVGHENRGNLIIHEQEKISILRNVYDNITSHFETWLGPFNIIMCA